MEDNIQLFTTPCLPKETSHLGSLSKPAITRPMQVTNITGSQFSQFSQSLTQTAGTMQITAQPQTHTHLQLPVRQQPLRKERVPLKQTQTDSRTGLTTLWWAFWVTKSRGPASGPHVLLPTRLCFTAIRYSGSEMSNVLSYQNRTIAECVLDDKARVVKL